MAKQSSGLGKPREEWEPTSFVSQVYLKEHSEDIFLQTDIYLRGMINDACLTDLQKTAFACWRNTLDLEFPRARPIEIEILRELRKLEGRLMLFRDEKR